MDTQVQACVQQGGGRREGGQAVWRFRDTAMHMCRSAYTCAHPADRPNICLRVCNPHRPCDLGKHICGACALAVRNGALRAFLLCACMRACKQQQPGLRGAGAGQVSGKALSCAGAQVCEWQAARCAGMRPEGGLQGRERQSHQHFSRVLPQRLHMRPCIALLPPVPRLHACASSPQHTALPPSINHSRFAPALATKCAVSCPTNTRILSLLFPPLSTHTFPLFYPLHTHLQSRQSLPLPLSPPAYTPFHSFAPPLLLVLATSAQPQLARAPAHPAYVRLRP